MPVLTTRSSTIFIATGKGTRVYRALDEVPAAMRRKLVQSTHGMNSATILIADKRGREELVRALRGDPSQVQCRLVDSIRSRQNPAPEASPKSAHRPFLSYWLEFLLPLMVGASLWFVTNPHL